MKYAIRSQFIPDSDHVFLAFDLSQAESWASAYLSQDETFKFNLKNKDVHTATASVIFDMTEEAVDKHYRENGSSSIYRYLGKKANHGLTYWMSAERWTEVVNSESEETGIIVSLPQMRVYRDKWTSLYWRIPMWWEEIKAILRTPAKTIYTPYGRKRTFYGIFSDQLVKEAIANVPQSTIADHTLGAIQPELGIEGGILKVRKVFKQYLGREIKLVHTAYDSIMLSVQKSIASEVAPQIYQCMHRPIIINGEECLVPVDGEIGERWGELQKLPKEKLVA